MRGLCHSCNSSNVDTTLDKFAKPICEKCKKTEESTL